MDVADSRRTWSGRLETLQQTVLLATCSGRDRNYLHVRFFAFPALQPDLDLPLTMLTARDEMKLTLSVLYL